MGFWRVEMRAEFIGADTRQHNHNVIAHQLRVVYASARAFNAQQNGEAKGLLESAHGFISIIIDKVRDKLCAVNLFRLGHCIFLSSSYMLQTDCGH